MYKKRKMFYTFEIVTESILYDTVRTILSRASTSVLYILYWLIRHTVSGSVHTGLRVAMQCWDPPPAALVELSASLDAGGDAHTATLALVPGSVRGERGRVRYF